MALGLTLIFGVMRIINIAHGSLYAWGGYSAATLGLASRYGLPPGWRCRPAGRRRRWSASCSAALLEIGLLRRILDKDPILQLLVTFAAFMVLEDLQRLIWGVQPYFVATWSASSARSPWPASPTPATSCWCCLPLAIAVLPRPALVSRAHGTRPPDHGRHP